MQVMNGSETAPEVSICIPTFNRSALLHGAIDSVLAQSFHDFEIIVADNASQDNTQAIVASYADVRIRYVRNTTNVGLRGNWNRCLQLARGRYIGFLPDDDLMLPENLARKVEVLSRAASIGLVHSKYHLIDGGGQVIGRHTNWGHGPERAGNVFEDRDELLAASYNYVNISASLFRRECYDKLGLFAPIRYAFDWEYFMRIAVHWQIYFLDEPLIKWRMHSGSITSSDVSHEVTKLRETLLVKHSVCNSNLNALPNARELKKTIVQKMVGRLAFQLGQMMDNGAPDSEVRTLIREAYRTFPAVFRDPHMKRLAIKGILGRRWTEVVRHIPFVSANRNKEVVPR